MNQEALAGHLPATRKVDLVNLTYAGDWLVPTETVDILYRHACVLERPWARANLPDGFASQQIDAVIRYLNRLAEHGALSAADLVDPGFVTGLLAQFWFRNGRRCYARRKARRTLPLTADLADEADRYRQTHDDDLLQHLAHDLIYGGERPEVVWVTFLCILGYDYNNISRLIERQIGRRIKPAALRVMKHRAFARLRWKIRRSHHLSFLGGSTHSQSVLPTEPTGRHLSHHPGGRPIRSSGSPVPATSIKEAR